MNSVPAPNTLARASGIDQLPVQFSLSVLSLKRLAGVHPDLARVVKRAIRMTPLCFGVCQALRDEATECSMVKKGKSLTMNSLHLPHRYAGVSTPCAGAVDLDALVDGKPRWDWDLYVKLNGVMQHAALLEAVPVEWGGLWHELKDGDHWQLPRARYPGVLC